MKIYRLYDTQSAALAKDKTGSLNRKRIFDETIRLKGIINIYQAIRLSRFLRKAEYSSWKNWRGIKKAKLTSLDEENGLNGFYVTDLNKNIT